MPIGSFTEDAKVAQAALDDVEPKRKRRKASRGERLLLVAASGMEADSFR